MTEFLEPRRLSAVSRIEKAGALAGAALIALGAMTSAVAWLSTMTTELGVALVAAVGGSVAKDWHWRRLFSRHRVDPRTVVYVNRGAYAQLLPNITRADTVELLGISLVYALEYVRDSAAFFQRVGKLRVMLPATKAICDERDRVQGSAPGSLWSARADTVTTLARLKANHPTQIEVRYVTVVPYAAITRVDDAMWVSPYVHKSGGSSPVLAISRDRSPELFHIYADYLEALWNGHTAPKVGAP